MEAVALTGAHVLSAYVDHVATLFHWYRSIGGLDVRPQRIVRPRAFFTRAMAVSEAPKAVEILLRVQC